MSSADPLAVVVDYHERTKHHYHRYASSLGYMDWANQPDPWRRWEGASRIALPRTTALPAVAYDALFAPPGTIPARPLTIEALGDFLRQSLALSAWKEFGTSRWALRVNPSSGNLHPTEAYVILPAAVAGVTAEPALLHYVSQDHALERRAALTSDAVRALFGALPAGAFVVGLSSILWREAWKYGERAFRYCQHDAGHALAALRLAAALLGWKLRLLDGWPHAAMAAVLGLDRASELVPEEVEEPELLAVVVPGDAELPTIPEPAGTALTLVRAARFFGRANHLSAEHVEWPAIDDVAAATRKPPTPPRAPHPLPMPSTAGGSGTDARTILQQRRSAVAMDGESSTTLDRFVRIMRRALPAAGAPWDALPFAPQVHLLLFVHRVSGLDPGLYFLARNADHEPRLRELSRDGFHWQRPDGVPADLPLYRLWPADARGASRSVSCHQEIASDGFFSLGMLARFEPALREHGPWFYRHLFWETGMIGQVLYLEAEALGVRSTGIGCFFDDPVHEAFGLRGREFQSLYHFTVGVPVDDARLTTQPAYG